MSKYCFPIGFHLNVDCFLRADNARQITFKLASALVKPKLLLTFQREASSMNMIWLYFGLERMCVFNVNSFRYNLITKCNFPFHFQVRQIIHVIGNWNSFQHKAPCILHCGGRKLNQFIPRCVELRFDGSKWWASRAVGRRGRGGGESFPPYFGQSINQGGKICPHKNTPPPGFQTFLQPWWGN